MTTMATVRLRHLSWGFCKSYIISIYFGIDFIQPLVSPNMRAFRSRFDSSLLWVSWLWRKHNGLICEKTLIEADIAQELEDIPVTQNTSSLKTILIRNLAKQSNSRRLRHWKIFKGM
ncbi:unnamed protein product [Albugo candida]|uniref:Uncharacterized protein n=1 Tax=Albugo candida TaxID=65357 RepID=A0A024G0T0_9STRA|nr:unnamed protein product [Albugo candida]|eukprot:CCI40437.1 unnamed protein product [Albugo candida]